MLEAHGVKELCIQCNERKADLCCMECMGNDLFCAACLVSNHQHLPFHIIQVRDISFQKEQNIEQMKRNGMEISSSELLSKILASESSFVIPLVLDASTLSPQETNLSFCIRMASTPLISISVLVKRHLSLRLSCFEVASSLQVQSPRDLPLRLLSCNNFRSFHSNLKSRPLSSIMHCLGSLIISFHPIE
jgi:hypothetical protein